MRSEFIKLKYPPIIWLSCIILLITISIIFSAHYLDVHNAVSLGRNPWERLFKSGIAIYRLFISVPFIVLFVSTAIYLERSNNGFKQLFTLPYSRSRLLIDKLLAILFCISILLLSLVLGLMVCGAIINIIYPEYEFNYYPLPIIDLIRSTCLTFISLLGIIGIQFFLSLRFKGFLLPTSLGILSYVISLILSSVNSRISLYFPYCYPTISRENGMLNNHLLGIQESHFLNHIEISSFIVFLLFATLGIVLERKRNL